MKPSLVLVLLVAALALATFCDAGEHFGRGEPYHKPPFHGKPPYDHEPPYGRDVNSDAQQHVDVAPNFHGYEPKPEHGKPYDKPPHEKHPPEEDSLHNHGGGHHGGHHG